MAGAGAAGGHPLSWHPGDSDFSCRFVLLVSGLGLGGGGGESLLGTQLLVDVVTGQLGDEGEQCSAAHVSRVILAGNLLSHNTQSRDSINKVRPPPARGQAPPASGRVGARGLACLVASAPQRGWGLYSGPASGLCSGRGWGLWHRTTRAGGALLSAVQPGL